MSDLVGEHTVRVRYCETDQMGVSHHGSYVAWIEEARTEWLRQRGKTYRELEADGVLLQVVELQIRYMAPTSYDDLIRIRTRVAERRRASITLTYELTLASTAAPVATATTTLACVDRRGKLQRLPPEV